MISKQCLQIFLFAILLFGLQPPANAQTPLLQPGKKTLYERVLTRPGARLARTADLFGDPDNRLLQAFSRFYVYERTRHEGATWLRIGADHEGREILGWVAEERTVPWKQQLTLALTNRGTVRDRLLFFHTWPQLKVVLDSSKPAEIVRPIIEKLERGKSDPRIAAIEPETFPDIHERFYLLPILDHVQVLSGTGELVRALKIASVTQHDPFAEPSPTRTARATPAAADARATSQYRAAVVFVIDSTISMGPYIEETKAAVEQVYKRLRQAEVIDRVGFGLVAFRAESTNAVRSRNLGYVTNIFVDPSQVRDAISFLRRVEDLRKADVSTDYFDEDALAGVIKALDKIAWEGFDARYIVLITDAGALDGSSIASSGPIVESTTGLDVSRVASIAGEKQVAITVFHLKTPEGIHNHRRAERQYRELARNARFQTEAYLPIKAGSVTDFRRAVDTLADAVIANVSQQDNVIPGDNPRPAAALPESNDNYTTQTVREIANALGHAMRLRYLGKVADARIPTVFEAWISDRDFVDPSKSTVEVRVLLNKDQLGDLHMILGQILYAAESGTLRPNQFFDMLRELAGRMGTDPNQIREATRVADLGLTQVELLEGLPYQSEVMNLSQQTWTAWGLTKQLEFISRLKRKLRQYARYSEQWDIWVDLAQTADGSGERVFPVPLADMP